MPSAGPLPLATPSSWPPAGSVTLPVEPSTSKAIYHLYVIRSNERDKLAEHLKANGVHTGLHYPLPVHLQNCYRHWEYQSGDLPVTEHAASQVLSLPMFPGITAEQQREVAAAINTFDGAERQATSGPDSRLLASA